MQYDKQDLPQYRFAEEINRVENATLLNYGFLDGGFYYAAEIEPTNRFFCELMIILPEMNEEQAACIENEKVDFIVTREYMLEDYEINSSRYTCIDSAWFYFEGKDFTYYLYKRDDI